MRISNKLGININSLWICIAFAWCNICFMPFKKFSFSNIYVAYYRDCFLCLFTNIDTKGAIYLVICCIYETCS